MKQRRFKVIFITGKIEIILALNFRDAEILAQAEQIKKGNRIEIIRTEELPND